MSLSDSWWLSFWSNYTASIESHCPGLSANLFVNSEITPPRSSFLHQNKLYLLGYSSDVTERLFLWCGCSVIVLQPGRGFSHEGLELSVIVGQNVSFIKLKNISFYKVITYSNSFFFNLRIGYVASHHYFLSELYTLSVEVCCWIQAEGSTSKHIVKVRTELQSDTYQSLKLQHKLHYSSKKKAQVFDHV